jgi:hypothetical protein
LTTFASFTHIKVFECQRINNCKVFNPTREMLTTITLISVYACYMDTFTGLMLIMTGVAIIALMC